MIGVTLHASQRQSLALQRRFAELLALDEVELDALVSARASENPALIRVRPPPAASAADRPMAGELDAAPTSLIDELSAQLRLERQPAEELAVGLELLGWLDERGLLTAPVDAVAHDLGVEPAVVERARRRVQQLDPPGCGSADPVEHLRALAAARWPEDPWVDAILAHHFADLQRGRFDQVGLALGLEPEDVEEYHRMVATLPPWPTAGRGDVGPAEVIHPLTVERCPDTGRFRLTPAADDSRMWRIDAAFVARTAAMPSGPARREREDHLRAARELLDQLSRRGDLVRQVAAIAVARQQGYLAWGPDHLEPLRMSTVAAILGCDGGTVSRAVRGTWLRWPGGLVRLRQLFVHRVTGAEGLEASIPALLAALRELIVGERIPRTDEELSRLLAQRGIGASRRTVARHRQALGFEGAARRGKDPSRR